MFVFLKIYILIRFRYIIIKKNLSQHSSHRNSSKTPNFHPKTTEVSGPYGEMTSGRKGPSDSFVGSFRSFIRSFIRFRFMYNVFLFVSFRFMSVKFHVVEISCIPSFMSFHAFQPYIVFLSFHSIRSDWSSSIVPPDELNDPPPACDGGATYHIH